MFEPHDAFNYTTPDAVAECWDGIEDELYSALWASMENMKPISEQIHIEDSSPSDAIGLNSLASVWKRFTPAQQERLNVLAMKNFAL